MRFSLGTLLFVIGNLIQILKANASRAPGIPDMGAVVPYSVPQQFGPDDMIVLGAVEKILEDRCAVVKECLPERVSGVSSGLTGLKSFEDLDNNRVKTDLSALECGRFLPVSYSSPNDFGLQLPFEPAVLGLASDDGHLLKDEGPRLYSKYIDPNGVIAITTGKPVEPVAPGGNVNVEADIMSLIKYSRSLDDNLRGRLFAEKAKRYVAEMLSLDEKNQ